MNATTLLFSLFLVAAPGLILGQKGQLGGIENPVVWLTAAAEKDGQQWFFIRTRGGDFFQKLENSDGSNGSFSSLNFQPAAFFDGRQKLKMPTLEFDWSQFSAFAVVCPADTFSEKTILFFEKNAQTDLFLTTERMADLGDGVFLPLSKKRSLSPQLIGYEQFKSADTVPVVSRFLIVGERPVLPAAPVESFKGKVAEMIFFDRVVSSQERAQIETYFALKYGLSLAAEPSAKLIDARGETLRGGQKDAGFGHRLAGLGRDDDGFFLQKQSANRAETPVLTIAAGDLTATNAENQTVFEDRTFWIWGDDGAKTHVDDSKKIGQPRFLDRTWKMTTIGQTASQLTEIRFDARAVDVQKRPAEQWFLALDSSGSGQFRTAETTFFAAAEWLENETTVFKNIAWSRAETVFSFALGPSLFAHFSMEKPTCQTPSSGGKITVRAVGGKAPFRFELSKTDGSFSKKWSVTNGDELHILENLEAGDYRLELVDADQKRFAETFFIDHADAPRPKIEGHYFLPTDGEPLVLDAAAGLKNAENCVFSWSSDGGFESNFSTVSILEAAAYRLRTERDGCVSESLFEVEKTRKDGFRRFEAIPNPAPDGRFSLEIGLFEPSEIEVEITDAAGRTLQKHAFEAADFFKIDLHLTAPAGAYTVRCRVKKGGTRGLRVIVL